MIKKPEYTAWLSQHYDLSTRKLVTDNISRAAKVEEKLKEQFGDDFSFEKQYVKDKGQMILDLMSHEGKNETANKVQLKPGILPVGTRQMYPLKAAVRRYFEFLADTM